MRAQPDNITANISSRRRHASGFREKVRAVCFFRHEGSECAAASFTAMPRRRWRCAQSDIACFHTYYIYDALSRAAE